MKLEELLRNNGVLESFENIGISSENVIGKLTEKTDEQYSKYNWFNGGTIVHAVPPIEMLKAGCPLEEWYCRRNGMLQHHILHLKKPISVTWFLMVLIFL
mgnify:CR=1 FL=1